MWSCFFFFSSRRRHTRLQGDWNSDVCSSDLDNRQEATHRVMREIASLPKFAAYIGDAAKVRADILPIRSYYDLLAGPQEQAGVEAGAVDVWHTVYQHPMDSAGAIVRWLRGTGLKPFRSEER